MDKIKYNDLEKYLSSVKAGTEEKPVTYDIEVEDIPDEAFIGDAEKSLPSEFGMKFAKAKDYTYYNLTFTMGESVKCARSCFNAEKVNIPLKNVVINREYKKDEIPSDLKEIYHNSGDLEKVLYTEDNGWMFYDCKDLESIDISSFKRMRMAPAMFAGCSNLEEVKVGRLDYLTSARSMFSGCKKLQNLSFDENFPNVKLCESMFGRVVKLQRINCRNYMQSPGYIFG